MEGWHGGAIQRSRCRPRGRPSRSSGRSAGVSARLLTGDYPLPLPSDSDGAALVPMVAPAHVPVYNVAMGPASLALTGETCRRGLNNRVHPRSHEVFLEPSGRARPGPDAHSPTSTWWRPSRSNSVPSSRNRGCGTPPRRRLRVTTIGAMGSRGWCGHQFPVSTRSPGSATAMVTQVRAGRPAKRDEARKPAYRVDLGRLTNLVGSDAGSPIALARMPIRGSRRCWRNFDGDCAAQLTTFSLLVLRWPNGRVAATASGAGTGQCVYRESARRVPVPGSVHRIDRGVDLWPVMAVHPTTRVGRVGHHHSVGGGHLCSKTVSTVSCGSANTTTGSTPASHALSR